MLSELYRQFLSDLQHTSLLEFLAVIAGILSVWYSRTENIFVYPTGLINTIAYIFLSFKYALFGEASVNLYYTVLNIYGWWAWTRRKSSIVMESSAGAGAREASPPGPPGFELMAVSFRSK